MAHQQLRTDKKVKTLQYTIKPSTQKQEELEKQWKFFTKIWNDREHVSEVSGEFLGGKEPLSIYFHHILPKELYPDAKYDTENIILMTWEEHSDVESNKNKFDIINELRKELLIKYKII